MGSSYADVLECGRPEGRLFFAGEYCSDISEQCVHGAFESGREAALAVARLLGRRQKVSLRATEDLSTVSPENAPPGTRLGAIQSMKEADAEAAMIKAAEVALLEEAASAASTVVFKILSDVFATASQGNLPTSHSG